MKRLAAAALLTVPLAFTSIELGAQQAHPTYLVYQDYVKASMIPQYEEMMRQLLGELADGPVRDQIQFVTIDGPELGYAYVIPIEGSAGIDVFRQAFQTGVANIEADSWSAMQARMRAAVDYRKSIVIELRPNLSYLAETVEMDAELPFRKYHWYYVVRGEEAQFEKVAMDLVDLYSRFDIQRGFRIYEITLGDDLPSYVMVERAESEADYATRTATIQLAVGNDADALFGRILQFTRRIEVMEGVIRPELSFPPFELASTGGRD